MPADRIPNRGSEHMIERLPTITEPTDSRATLWRFMDFTKYVAMLHRAALPISCRIHSRAYTAVATGISMLSGVKAATCASASS
jgi:hypothetical protein